MLSLFRVMGVPGGSGSFDFFSEAKKMWYPEDLSGTRV